VGVVVQPSWQEQWLLIQKLPDVFMQHVPSDSQKVTLFALQVDKHLL
jgi:hypothetical protein